MHFQPICMLLQNTMLPASSYTLSVCLHFYSSLPPMLPVAFPPLKCIACPIDTNSAYDPVAQQPPTA